MPRTLVGQPVYGNGLQVAAASLQYASSASVASTATNNFTVACWLYINAYSAGTAVFFENGGSDSNGYEFRYTSAGVLNFDFSFVANLSSAVTLSTATWYHVAAIRNAGTTQIYIDGSTAGGTSASTPNAPGTRTNIGARRTVAGTASLYANAIIDDARIYDRVLSVSELGNLVSQATNPTIVVDSTSLKLRWKADETSGTSLTDSSGNSITGTTSGTPTFVQGKVLISNVPARTVSGTRTVAGTRTIATP